MNISNGSSKMERRGQIVLVAAIFIAVALVPIVFAYLQLGYVGDVEASGEHTAPVMNAERLLGHAVHEAGTNASAEYEWNRRDDAVIEVRDRLQAGIGALERSRIAEGGVYHVSYNDSAAAAWSTTHCPSGPARQFGPCETDRGVVVQERAGETHVLAVAFDVTSTTERGQIEATMLITVIE